MKSLSTRLRLPFTLLLTLAFYYLFWDEQQGVNLFIFSTALMGSTALIYPKAWHHRYVQLVGLGTFLAAILVVFHHSGTAKVVHHLSLLVLIGLVHAPMLRSITHAIFQAIYSYAHGIASLFYDIKHHIFGTRQLPKYVRFIQLTIIPIIILGLFAIIFALANPRFGAGLDELISVLGTILMHFSLPKIFFLLLGLFITIGALYPSIWKSGLAFDAKQVNQLQRTRRFHKKSWSFLDLKKEYQVGILTLGLVNLLLLINNVLDFDWIWLNFTYASTTDVTQFVHEGTYLLILSILLSIGIMLYFFRGNLNFYPNGRWLRYLSYAWIVQNGFLTCSVALRNFHYIDFYGLAYKRIGVFFFLALVLFGLITLLFKIRDKMSAYYLFRVNSWAVYVVALFLAMVNWDVFIARYNFRHYAQTGWLDRGFLLNLSDKALPVILEHYEDMVAPSKDGSTHNVPSLIRQKVDQYQHTWEDLSWKSWNYADAQALAYLGSFPAH